MMYGCSMQHSLVWICCLVSRCMHVGFLAHRMKSVMLWHAKQLTLRFQSLRLRMSSSFIVDSGWLFVRNLLSVLPYQSYTHIGAIAQFHIELLFTVGGLLQLVAVQCFYCFLYQLVCLVCKQVLGYSQLWLTNQAINSIQVVVIVRDSLSYALLDLGTYLYVCRFQFLLGTLWDC